MKRVDTDVRSLAGLAGYFFVVPDYQREYVWKKEDQVEQFLQDIDSAYNARTNNTKDNSYFIGSIIITKNKYQHDVIDGQQRLTTIVIMLCAFRDLLEDQSLDTEADKILAKIKRWLSELDLTSRTDMFRLELQYEESKDYLNNLISGESDNKNIRKSTDSIKKMHAAHGHIKKYLDDNYLKDGTDALINFALYFLTKIDMVVIESKSLGDALTIFETINQRGARLTAIDLVKSLLFRQIDESKHEKMKDCWKDINKNLQSCNEKDRSLRFLKYFLMARYHDGDLQDSEAYNWIVSEEGVKKMDYKEKPFELAEELIKISKLYADLIKATGKKKKGQGTKYPAVERLGLINGHVSRQHLVALLALKEDCDDGLIEELAKELESLFFFNNTIRILAKRNIIILVQLASELRDVQTKAGLTKAVNKVIVPHVKEVQNEFKQIFAQLQLSRYSTKPSQKHILGQIENTACRLSGQDEHSQEFFQTLDIEHIFPQTPKGGLLPDEFPDSQDYKNTVGHFANITLLESTHNQAISKYNDLSGGWFEEKQKHYRESRIMMTGLLYPDYHAGKDTKINKFINKYNYKFKKWNKDSIDKRQKTLLEIAMETWLINGQRADAL